MEREHRIYNTEEMLLERSIQFRDNALSITYNEALEQIIFYIRGCPYEKQIDLHRLSGDELKCMLVEYGSYIYNFGTYHDNDNDHPEPQTVAVFIEELTDDYETRMYFNNMLER